MRTDSVNLAQDAIVELRELIGERYGKENVPEEPRLYRTKAKNAQEAHEAIRPTSAMRAPDSIQSFLSPEQFKLYDLIWKRTVASQMIAATIDTLTLDMAAGKEHQFRSTGSAVLDPGFMRVYQEGTDEKPEELGEEHLLPHLEEGEEVKLNEISCRQA